MIILYQIQIQIQIRETLASISKSERKTESFPVKSQRKMTGKKGKLPLTSKKKRKRSIANKIKSNLINRIVRIRFNHKSGRPPLQFCKERRSKHPIDEEQALAFHFEEEILMDILTRLPVQSLLRSKCVSKYWKTLISDPYFKMMHLSRAKKDLNSQKLLVSFCCPKENVYSLYCCPLLPVQPVEDVQKLDCPFFSKPWNCVICCCCDGLVMIMITEDERSLFFLYNPSTRESLVLPDPEFPMDGNFCLGLGYDSTSGDYKILKIHNGKDGSTGELLSLKSGSWRIIDKHPAAICNLLVCMDSLAFVHEAFHWIGSTGNCSVVSRRYLFVVSFSISNEVYGEIPLPEQMVGSYGVSVLEGMLCACCTSIRGRRHTYKMWVLKDYAVKDSWCAWVTIDDPCTSDVIPKYRFANGEVLFSCFHKQSLGIAFRTSRGPFALWPHSGFQNGITFTESLISPKSLTY